MRAVRHTPEGIRPVEVPVPTKVAVGAAEGVRIRPRSVGICQTDLNMVGFGPREMTFGHEFAGVLDDGTPVAIEPMVPCGVCEFCGMGDYHWCEKSHEMIAGVAFDGGMADEILLPERCLVRLPHGLDVANACLCEPLAVNIHSLMLGRLESRHRVAVVGPGITGFGLLGGAAALLAHRPEIAEAMITQRFPLDAAGEAFALAASDTPTLKVVVEP